MTTTQETLTAGPIVEKDIQLTLADLSYVCSADAEWLLKLVEEGFIEPESQSSKTWYFSGTCLRRVRQARNLQQDLGINLPGAALAVELLEEIDRLRLRIAALEALERSIDPY